MAKHIDGISDFYNQVQALAAQFGLTVSDAILVLAVEAQARTKRANFNVVAIQKGGA